jgi:Phytanoyl-CoA dioxygenase (PhyH)
MGSRLATEEEVKRWQTDGWVLLDALIPTEEIDAANEDLKKVFPTNDEYQSDPEGVTERWKGRPAQAKEDFVWPDEGPGFRPEQHFWSQTFPFPGEGSLNRICVHPSVVDFAERALGDPDIRLYQIHASAKYSGLTNYEQPMHTDQNHSWLPAIGRAPWWNLEGFLYMTDVTESANPTRMVSVRHTQNTSPKYPVLMPDRAPDVYEAEQAAVGVRGSYLAYRSDVFHRGAAFAESGTSRTVLALAFKLAAQEWIGYDEAQSRSNSPEWTRFVEKSTPRELELFGFPPPGHEIWDEDLLRRTRSRYPKLDLTPWSQALAG